MKNYLFNILIIGLLIIINGTSCSKYDDGGITLQAENKISPKNWILDSDEIYFRELYSFQKDGHFERTTIIGIQKRILYGKWELINKNKTLRLRIFNTDTNVITRRLDIWETIDTDSIQKDNLVWYINQNQESNSDRIIDYKILKLTKNEFDFQTTISNATNIGFVDEVINVNLKTED